MTDRTSGKAMPGPQGTSQPDTIRDLNDRFRKLQIGGAIIATPSIMDMGPHAVHQIMQNIATYEDFTEENNPYGENDFGVVNHDGNKIFWKIDYYNTDFTAGSSNPADPSVTARVMTVLKASEW